MRRRTKMKAKHDTREKWLIEMTDKLRPVFKQSGYALPKQIRLSCGWPSTRPLSEKKRAIGECWFPNGPKGYANIFISPYLEKDIEVADTLLHELVHAAVGKGCGHKGPFINCMKAMGMEGKPTESVAGPEMKERLNKLIKTVGKYPHEKLDKTGRKKQSTRLIKCECPGCGYIIRTTQRWIDEGVPTCVCHRKFVVRWPEDE